MAGIIDIHCHAAGIGAGGSGCFVSEKMRRSWKYRIYLSAFGITEAELEQQGDTLIFKRLSDTLRESQQVEAAVILAMDGVIDTHGNLDRKLTEMHLPNHFVAHECSRYDNLLFGAGINPYRRDALEQVDAAAAQGAVLLKWLPSIQHIDPADQRIIPFYRRLAELGLPLLTHTGSESSFTYARNELADPVRLNLALEQGVTVIAAHCASNGRSEDQSNFSRLLPMFDRHPNLYGDISALTQVNRLGHLTRVLKNEKLHGRLVYGTDMPLLRTGITSPWFQTFRLPLRVIRDIAAIENPWDQDVALKQALGVTQDIFTRTADLIRSPKKHQTYNK